MRIVFMGTPAFAVASLRRLVEDGQKIVGVFTQPDKPKSRGMRMSMSPVKEYALQHDLPVFQPQTMRGEEPLAQLRALAPDLTVVAAYGQLLPEAILNVPRLGSVNVHASLLPRYRGAAPINWVILNGETETGVTLMHMVKKLDAGDMIAAVKTPIDPAEDAAALYDRLALLGAELLAETLPQIADGTAVRIPQDDAQSCYAPMLSRELSPIDWTRNARAVVNQVRGLQPWPCAATEVDGKTLKIHRAELCDAAGRRAGTLLADRRGILAACGDGSILITEVQPEGGKRMTASAYLNGRRITTGTVLREGRE